MQNPADAHPDFPQSLFSTPVVAALFTEALALIGEGVSAVEVEAASVEAGMPAGLLATIDATSLDVIDEALHAELHALEHGEHQPHGDAHPHGDHAHEHGHEPDHDHGHSNDRAPKPATSHTHAPAQHRHAHSVRSKRMPEPAVYVVEKMAHGFRRSGRAAGGGFYDYTSDTPELWSGLKTFERRGKALPRQEVIDRLWYIAVLTVLGHPAVPAPASASPSLGALFGPSLPTDSDAARAWITMIGPKTFVYRSQALAARFGDRFNPSADVLATVGAA